MISSLFFSLLLVSFAMADELAATTVDNTWKYGTSGGVLGFIVLILDIMVFSTSLLCLLSPFPPSLPVPIAPVHSSISPHDKRLASLEGLKLIW
jgi:hypothetical protein